ncbi:hypothetical protein D1J63_20235 [Streptomyces sp. KPB2]|nr:hypothetical protein D1J63_20235 [Streptomyces sp. KPB2]
MDVVVFRGELSNRFPPLHVPAIRHRPVADVRVPHLWDCWDFAIVDHHEVHHETGAPTPTRGRRAGVRAGRRARARTRGPVATAASHRDPRHFAPPFTAVVRLTHRGSTIHHRRHR